MLQLDIKKYSLFLKNFRSDSVDIIHKYIYKAIFLFFIKKRTPFSKEV